ncbi:MAG: hypothetical protein AAF702_01775 [Chloroflexota bacterium]
MVSTSAKIDQILSMARELSHNDRVGLIQRMIQLFLSPHESALEDTNDETISIFSHHPQRDLMLQEESAFDAMIEELQSDFLGQYVAILHGAVIDHDVDITSLSNRMIISYPEQVVLIRQVLSDPEPELRWRSVRFIE